MPNEDLSSSLEDYLEIILHLQQRRRVARAKEIGEHMRVNRSSVTTALQALARRGLVNYSPYDYITLTDSGVLAAEDVARRHEIMRRFLVTVLRIEEPEAGAAACRMEHALSGVVLERLASFLDFVNRCPEGLADWTAATGFHCKSKAPDATCDACPRNRGARRLAGRRGSRK